MFLSKKTPLVAIDIGSHSIKLAQLAVQGRKYELLNFGMMPLDQDSIVDGVVKKEMEVVDALANLVKAEKVETRYVVASVSGEAVIIKRIKVPVMSREELDASINQEAEQYIPFDIDDVRLDYQILNSNGSRPEEEEDGEKMEILLVAVQREIIENRMDVLLEAGLRPVIIDLDVFAMVNALSLSTDVTTIGPAALIDLGDSFTHLNIVSDGISAFTRDIPIGGGICTNRLMHKFDVSFGQATQLKQGVLSQGIDREAVTDVIVNSFEKILAEIEKSFEFFSTTSNAQVERVFLCGGGALIPGVDQLLSEYLGVPVEVFDPMKPVKFNTRKFDRELIHRLSPLAAVVLGLATRRFDYI